MITLLRWLSMAIATLVVSAALSANTQVANVTATDARAFVGTWVFSMSNLGGSQQTVRIWEEDGVLKASVQVGKGAPTGVTGIVKDGDMLVLSVSHAAQTGAARERPAHLGIDLVNAAGRDNAYRRDAGAKRDHQARNRKEAAGLKGPLFHHAGREDSGRRGDRGNERPPEPTESAI
jgi:hypothetical protein